MKAEHLFLVTLTQAPDKRIPVAIVNRSGQPQPVAIFTMLGSPERKLFQRAHRQTLAG